MIRITKTKKEDLEQIRRLFNEYDYDIEKHFPKDH